jgi:cytoskeletal protein CcmA (bactofilin family)
MRDCTIVGGRLTIHGRFFEGGRTGIRDPHTLVVSKTGVLAARILQPAQPTQFAFERGCRLRLDISGADPLEHVHGKRTIMADTTEKKTFVEEGTEFVGTLRAKCPVVVRGSLEGDLEAPAVAVTSTGKVTGNVKAVRVQSEGVLAGSIEADEISLAGVVKSNTVIRAKSLEVKLAADRGKLEVTFGECIVEVGDMPSAEDRADTRDTKSATSELEEPSKRARKRKGDADTDVEIGESASPGPNGADPHPLV